MSSMPSILIVEDDDGNREALRALLEVFGYPVHEADNGERGVEAALSGLDQVVLLDIGLPDMDGYEVAYRIRSAPGGDRPYLVALTGHGRDEDRRRTRAAGFDAHLVKPADPKALKEILAEACRRTDLDDRLGCRRRPQSRPGIDPISAEGLHFVEDQRRELGALRARMALAAKQAREFRVSAAALRRRARLGPKR